MNVTKQYSRQTQTVLVIARRLAGLDMIRGPLEARGLEVALAQDFAGNKKLLTLLFKHISCSFYH